MGRGTVRALVVASVAMAVLIVLGVAALLVVVTRRALAPAGGPAASVALAEPAGTRIAGAVGPVEALVLRLVGGGADRVVVVDARSGRVLARVGLAP